ncbi:hypothetical protein IWZ00DRAFT_574756 [Phyllosticta capitalensis]
MSLLIRGKSSQWKEDEDEDEDEDEILVSELLLLKKASSNEAGVDILYVPDTIRSPFLPSKMAGHARADPQRGWSLRPLAQLKHWKQNNIAAQKSSFQNSTGSYCLTHLLTRKQSGEKETSHRADKLRQTQGGKKPTKKRKSVVREKSEIEQAHPLARKGVKKRSAVQLTSKQAGRQCSGTNHHASSLKMAEMNRINTRLCRRPFDYDDDDDDEEEEEEEEEEGTSARPRTIGKMNGKNNRKRKRTREIKL